MIRRAALLALATCSAAIAIAAAPRPFLRAQGWTAPDHLPAALSAEPGSCLRAPANPEQARSIALGAAAFRAPLLLGGQAARSGLSCNSCHRGGHDNPGFAYPGLSGAPGTADVTSSLFSSHRGDGQFNPKPIPNLSGSKTLLKIDQDPASGKLEPFILGLITEEFDGPAPSPAVLAGLVSYVRALDPAACRAPVPLDLAAALGRVDAALGLAETSAAEGDGATAAFLVAAARSEMGLIDERYPAPGLGRSTARLRAAGAALGQIERAMAANPAAALVQLRQWRRGEAGWKQPLLAGEKRSLFNPVNLSAAFAVR